MHFRPGHAVLVGKETLSGLEGGTHGTCEWEKKATTGVGWAGSDPIGELLCVCIVVLLLVQDLPEQPGISMPTPTLP